MLIGIQVYAVNDTGGGDGLSVKESALEICSDLHVGVCETDAAVLGAAKLQSDFARGMAGPLGALGRADLGRANYQDGRHGHSRFYGRVAYLIYKCSDTLCR